MRLSMHGLGEFVVVHIHKFAIFEVFGVVDPSSGDISYIARI